MTDDAPNGDVDAEDLFQQIERIDVPHVRANRRDRRAARR